MDAALLPGSGSTLDGGTMEHRALALEYRPQKFDDIAGQSHVTAVLSRSLVNGRVHHCYLFSGPRGVGKTTTARILAKILNCPNSKDGVPCNKCEVCRDVTSGVSLDVQEIDGASNRGIADVQQLRENVRFAPAGGRYRVVIIDEVHQLSGDAFAALLKTLEEPPPHVVFIFATTDPLKLPDTIRSRCQRYDFGRLPTPDVVARLKEIAKQESKRGEKITITDEAAFLLARKSEGSMRDAVSALDQVLSTGVTTVDEAAVNEVLGLVSREIFFDLGERFLSRDAEGTLATLHNAYREGVDPRDLAEGMLDHLRSLLVLRVNPKADDLVVASEDERKRFDEQGRDHETADLLRLMRIVTEALGAMRDSAQPLTHLEVAVVEMASLEPGVHLAEIVDRLGGLEGGPNNPTGGGGSSGESKSKTPPRKRTAVKTKKSSDAPTASLETTVGTSVARGSASSPVSSQGAQSTPPAVVADVSPDVSPAVAPDSGDMARPTSGVDLAESETTVAVVEAEPIPSASEPDPKWEQVLHEVKDKKVMVGVFLEESRRVGWDGSVLQIAADEVHRSILEAPDNRDLLLKVLAAVYEKRVMVRFLDLPPEERKRRKQIQASSSAAGGARRPEASSAGEPATAGATSTAGTTSAPAESVSPPTSSNEGAEEPLISPEIEKAMVWFEGEIVQQSKPGGASR